MICTEAKVSGRLSQSITYDIQLLLSKLWRAPRSVRIGKTSKSFSLEAVYPILDNSYRITEHCRHFRTGYALRNQKYGMKSVIIARLMGTAYFILKREHHSFRV